jgi:DNA repair exonuclease SbcCD ATPase subunit
MINTMDKYFQRTDDAVLADKLMKCGQKLAVWLTDSDDLTTFHLIHYSDNGFCVDGVLQENLKWQSDFLSWAAYKQAEFLLPIPDPTTKLKEQERIIAVMETEIETFSRDANNCKQAYNKASERIENLEMQVLGLATDRAKLKNLNDRLRGELNEVTERDSRLGTDLIDEMNVTAQLDDMIEESDKVVAQLKQENSIYKSDIAKLNSEVEILQETLEDTQSSQKSYEAQVKQGREAMTGLLKALNLKISVLNDNLDRANADRLSEITMIMRLIQALDKTPQANLIGALYLIKRVLFNAICKLDPSQAIDL